MFGHRYFGVRYFGQRYWGGHGGIVAASVSVTITGGGADESDAGPSELFTSDKSGWRKPQWVRDREEALAKEAAQPIAPSKTESPEPALVERQALDASIGLERRGVAPIDIEPDPAGPAAAQPLGVVEIERARIAARLRQERELELITTMLLMAA